MSNVQLTLDETDTELLRQVLTRAISSTREEVGKTENYVMRQELKDDEARLKALLERLKGTGEPLSGTNA